MSSSYFNAFSPNNWTTTNVGHGNGPNGINHHTLAQQDFYVPNKLNNNNYTENQDEGHHHHHHNHQISTNNPLSSRFNPNSYAVAVTSTVNSKHLPSATPATPNISYEQHHHHPHLGFGENQAFYTGFVNRSEISAVEDGNFKYANYTSTPSLMSGPTNSCNDVDNCISAVGNYESRNGGEGPDPTTTSPSYTCNTKPNSIYPWMKTSYHQHLGKFRYTWWWPLISNL